MNKTKQNKTKETFKEQFEHSRFNHDLFCFVDEVVIIVLRWSNMYLSLSLSGPAVRV